MCGSCGPQGIADTMQWEVTDSHFVEINLSVKMCVDFLT